MCVGLARTVYGVCIAYMTAYLVISLPKILEGVDGASVLKCDIFDANHV